IPQARAYHLDIFLQKLEEMGHKLNCNNGIGIHFKATALPKAVSFKTGPYPGFPTDLQAPMMALQTKAAGKAIVEETVFENRFLHIPYLQKMGACIHVSGNKATVVGVEKLQGQHVIACDIRAAMALVIAGLVAEGETIITDIHHWNRGYDRLEQKLSQLGAPIQLCNIEKINFPVNLTLVHDSNNKEL